MPDFPTISSLIAVPNLSVNTGVQSSYTNQVLKAVHDQEKAIQNQSKKPLQPN